MGARVVVLLAACLTAGCYARVSTGVEARAATEKAASEAPPPSVECPRSTRWDGEVCVWRYVIADVSCPEGAAWDGSYCVVQDVRCPEGAEWRSDHCGAIVDAPSAPPEAAAEAGAPATKDPAIFDAREGKTGTPTEPVEPGEIFDGR